MRIGNPDWLWGWGCPGNTAASWVDKLALRFGRVDLAICEMLLWHEAGTAAEKKGYYNSNMLR